jgi:hypothetical protein
MPQHIAEDNWNKNERGFHSLSKIKNENALSQLSTTERYIEKKIEGSFLLSANRQILRKKQTDG